MVKVITPPSVEPLTVDEVKTRLSIMDSLDDPDIAAHISAAREAAESFTSRAFVERELEFALDYFPSEIEVPVLPVSSITSIRYIDGDGNEQTVPADQYGVDDYGPRHWIIRAAGTDWPATYDAANAVKVRYVAGYGPDGSFVPEPIKNALLIAIGHWIRFQAVVESGVGPTRMPFQFYDLLSPYRVFEVS